MEPLIAIRAVDIDIEGQPLDAHLPASWIDAKLADANLSTGVGDWEGKSGSAGGQLTGTASRSGPDILVRARVQAEVILACSRCLGPATIPVDAELSLLLQPRAGLDGRHLGVGVGQARGHEGEYEFTAEEADLDVFDGETVVLDPFIREAILLELPQFPLCSDGCVGIPPRPSGVAGLASSTAAPVDPRLAPLGALRSKLTGEPASQSTAPSGLEPGARPTDRGKVLLRSTSRRGLRKTKRKRRR